MRVRSVKSRLVSSLLAVAALGCATSAPQPDFRAQARAQLEIGVDHLRNGRKALALREFMHAERLDRESARIQLALGEGYLMSKRPEQAEKHFRNALELDPSEFDARMHLSALLIHSGRYREALEECGLLAEDPTFPAPWRALHNCGHAYLELGELQEARDSFEQALAYGVDFWEATLSLGILAKREGRREEALERFREVLDRNPGASATSEVHYHLGEVYVSLGQRQQALAHLDDSITAAPRGVWADRSEAYRELIR